jgi:putative DNA primase/helicase
MSADEQEPQVIGVRNGKVYPPLIADYLIARQQFYAPDGINGSLYIYDKVKGIYNDANPLVALFSAKTLNGRSNKHICEETIYNLKSKVYLGTVKTLPLNMIPVKNGLFNIDSMKLEPFSSDYFVTSKLPVNYMEGADCPVFKKFVADVVPKDGVDLAQEVYGYTLQRDYRHQKAVMLQGEGENGKSVFLACLKSFLGVENVSSVSLQNLSEDRFAKSSLYMKLANIYPDLPHRDITETGDFKALTGGDLIETEFKFKNRFRFVNYAKLIFSGNRMPSTNDDSVAFYRRWIIIVFPNTFPVGDPKRDDQILDKITTDEELSGILNWAMAGLRRLNERKAFTYARSTEEIRKQYDRLSDSVKAFCNERLEYDPLGELRKDDLYSIYEGFCRETNLMVKPKNMFGKGLKRCFPEATAVRTGDEGNYEYLWRGVVLAAPEERVA